MRSCRRGPDGIAGGNRIAFARIDSVVNHDAHIPPSIWSSDEISVASAVAKRDPDTKMGTAPELRVPRKRLSFEGRRRIFAQIALWTLKIDLCPGVLGCQASKA